MAPAPRYTDGAMVLFSKRRGAGTSPSRRVAPPRGASSILVAIAIALSSSLSIAQPKGKGQPAGPAFDAKGAAEKLKSGESGRVLEALAAAQAAGPAAQPLGPVLEDIVRKGSSTEVTKAALEALGAIGQQSSSGVIRPYLRHRVADIRRAAVRALGGTKGSEAVLAFKEGLRSGDGQVRGFSATGLGNLGAADALPDLFLALDRNVTEAAAAIGQLCAPQDCEKFAGRLGRVGFDVMTSGFDPILFRARALPDEALIKIVGRLRELGTADAGKYLADVQSRWPKGGSPKVKQAIDSAVASLPRAK
jgi:HEAT repeat protein